MCAPARVPVSVCAKWGKRARLYGSETVKSHSALIPIYLKSQFSLLSLPGELRGLNTVLVQDLGTL